MTLPRIVPAFWLGLLLAFCATADSATGAAIAGEDPVAYPRDIRPILAKNCFRCHGPDEDTREAELRLDVRDAAVADRDGVAAIVPGDPAESELYERVAAEDEDERMPPPDSNLKLSPEEIERLRRWIAQGAEYEAHWSLIAPRRPEPPGVAQANWPRNDLDRFVLAKLQAEKLTPSPEADRYTLVRRLYLDLIGLLPTVEETDAFVRDARPDAYEQLVDHLLASPHYGERWARPWLDLARYADTNGYEKDRTRSIWPYRDWVINALNRDMPFNQFTIEQIAGDMLPDATLEQKIATGFHRNTMLNEEGGVDAEEFRYASTVDRINTTGAVWLGLTIGCAQCHTHKYDPISNHEYYQLLAFLNNADEPETQVPDPAIAQRRAELETQIAAIEVDLENRFPLPEKEDVDRAEYVRGQLAAWKQEAAKRASRWTRLRPVRMSAKKNTTLTVLDDLTVLASGDTPNQDTYEIDLLTDLKEISALRLEVLPHESLPGGGPGRASVLSLGDFLLSEIEVAAAPANGDQPLVPVKLQNATHSYAPGNRSAAHALDGRLDTGWSVGGQIGRAHRAVFEFAEPIVSQQGTRLRITLAQQYIHALTIGRFRISLSGDKRPVEAATVPGEIEAILATPEAELSDGQREQLKRYYLSIAPPLAEEHKRIAHLRNSMPRHSTTLTIVERLPEHARKTHVHHRGEYAQLREEVQPEVPAALHPLPANAPRNRLSLARWLVDEKNPLVGRVLMNRHWQAFFGRGLVRTVEDFGTQGANPTHPQLLDWLATELVRGGWSLKHMHRLIATSATYRQSSQISPELLERDPDNLLLARGPRFRIEAESIRDLALTASGLLTRTVGGPSVFPPQPAGVTELSWAGMTWKTETGANRYRRALYTFSKRTSPYAMFTLFDAPSGETCIVSRGRSNTPLQALTMLNDTVFVELCQSLARRALSEGPETTGERITYAFRRFLMRPPSDEEIHQIAEFYDRQLERFRAGELDAKQVCGAKPEDLEAIDVEAWAAWTMVCRAILNFDETLTKQ